MALPFELTTFPNGSLDIIRYLASCDSYAASDEAIIAGTALSERSFGKAIRRLVTREYVEMQVDGTYQLTRQGLDAAEAIAVHDEEAAAEMSYSEAGEIGEEEEAGPPSVTRSALAIFPRTFAAGRPGYFFVRVEEAAEPETELPVDMLFRLSGDCEIFPEQDDAAVPPQAAADPVRFEITPAAAGDFNLKLEVYHITQSDLISAGSLRLTLKAGSGGQSSVFQMKTFTLTFQPGM